MASAPPCTLFCLAFFAVVALLPCVMPQHSPVNDTASKQLFDEWTWRYGHVYNDAAERAYRYTVFKGNLDYIERSNMNTTRKYKLGINQFGDLTVEEIIKMINNTEAWPPRRPPVGAGFRYGGDDQPPQHVDWRLEGAVTHIKDQGPCGSCWVFAVVATIESMHKISTGWLVPLSEQELMDCSRGNACKGGYEDYAYDTVIQLGGLTGEYSYRPYAAVDNDWCPMRNFLYPLASIRGYEYVPANNEQALKRAVANQPVYVVISIGSPEFFFYRTGVFDGPCQSVISKENGLHAVAVIGYGVESDGTKYWLVKNSWGTGWGECGFGKIGRETGKAQGICGIAEHASYPTA